MKYACVKNGVVNNIIVAEPDVLPELVVLGCEFYPVLDGDFVDIGFLYQDGQFVAPVEEA